MAQRFSSSAVVLRALLAAAFAWLGIAGLVSEARAAWTSGTFGTPGTMAAWCAPTQSTLQTSAQGAVPPGAQAALDAVFAAAKGGAGAGGAGETPECDCPPGLSLAFITLAAPRDELSGAARQPAARLAVATQDVPVAQPRGPPLGTRAPPI